MFEATESEPREEPGDENGGLAEDTERSGDAGDVTGQEGEGAGAAAATPQIGDEGEHEQTTSPAPPEDAQKRSDEESSSEE